ncbi:MAG TPA: hypothetical protein VMJ93_03620 [Verrucomicrobiae bacterium]|nr:hypothetical protein [Verrucomicrobiae bacterium]
MAHRNPSDSDPLVHISHADDSAAGETSPFYELRGRVVWFSEEMRREHRRLKSSLWHYIRHSRFFVALTSPLIYGCVVPFFLLDIFVTLYQAFSFPIYGIPKVVRSDYLMFDRGKLCYLNFLERLNCQYCAYANGLLAYVVEVAGRTEQHWCPVKHAHRNLAPHSRYSHFLPYGNASAYREHIDEVRQDFKDIKKQG